MSRREKKFCSSNKFEWLTMKKLFHLKNDKLATFSSIGSQQQYFGVGSELVF